MKDGRLKYIKGTVKWGFLVPASTPPHLEATLKLVLLLNLNGIAVQMFI